MHMETLKQESEQLVGHRLPKETFMDFTHPNNRMLVGVTCLRAGFVDVAYHLFSSIAQEGPKENPNHQFAFVRSLVEMAEIDAERENFSLAAESMKRALEEFPESMSYMMSRVHLEVYLTYYLYLSGEKEVGMQRIQEIVEREKQQFVELPRKDAVSLIGPGLCYAIHQWSLFLALEGEWELAIDQFKEMVPYTVNIDSEKWDEAERIRQVGTAEEAYHAYVSAVQYNDNQS
ncbi:hypothetical protein [Hazenella coriacea]|uniref:Tetratricopeptide repeat protein n=1 Tax=Hazenella coriacea TaxID=1179467 RepID=A0A4R3LCK3_9BACL|nr:hypothetical protein [Hazenella coriacea]TCS97038.1 hypothetical protein EDD58_101686 [Hazenella coriacea]